MNKDEMRRMLYELDALFQVKEVQGVTRMVCTHPCEGATLVSKLMQELDGQEPEKVSNGLDA